MNLQFYKWIKTFCSEGFRNIDIANRITSYKQTNNPFPDTRTTSRVSRKISWEIKFMHNVDTVVANYGQNYIY